MDITYFLVMIAAILLVSIACAYSIKGFSANSFFTAMAIGIGVLTWYGTFPIYAIVLSVTLIAGMLFADRLLK